VPRRSASLPLDIAGVALLLVAVTVYIASRRLRRQSDDLATADKQLRQLGHHNRDQAEKIAELEEERPTKMFEAMQREIGEMLIELDGPAGPEVDGPAITTTGHLEGASPAPAWDPGTMLADDAAAAREPE
jgi:hypothetical protein